MASRFGKVGETFAQYSLVITHISKYFRIAYVIDEETVRKEICIEFPILILLLRENSFLDCLSRYFTKKTRFVRGQSG